MHLPAQSGKGIASEARVSKNLHFPVKAMAPKNRNLLVFLALSASFSYCFSESSRKELRDKEVNQESGIQLRRSSPINRVNPSRVVQLSWKPRVFLYEGFLTDEECDHLVGLEQGEKEALVGTSRDSGNVDEKIQLPSSGSSSGTDDELVKRIQERISAWTMLPEENSQPLKTMHYGLEKAKDKLDYFGNNSTFSWDKPLMSTVIIYLSNVSQGGQLLFPDSEPKSSAWSDCTKSSTVLRPVKGNAILFFSAQLDASPDKHSSHSRCPVQEGDMWVATKFFFLKPIASEKNPSDADGECTDEDENCPSWAAHGECQRNPVFMTGSPDYYGTCRKSCNVC